MNETARFTFHTPLRRVRVRCDLLETTALMVDIAEQQAFDLSEALGPPKTNMRW